MPNLTVGIIPGAKIVRLTIGRPEGGEYTFDMTVNEAAAHMRHMNTAVGHLTGVTNELVLPKDWQK